MHAQTTKVTNHETPYLVRRLEREARDGVLWMGLASDAVLKHRRKEHARSCTTHDSTPADIKWAPRVWEEGGGRSESETHSSSHLMRLSSVSSAKTPTTAGVTPSVPA